MWRMRQWYIFSSYHTLSKWHMAQEAAATASESRGSETAAAFYIYFPNRLLAVTILRRVFKAGQWLNNRWLFKRKTLLQTVDLTDVSRAFHFSNMTRGWIWLERRRNFSGISTAIFQGSIIFWCSLFLLSELKKHQLHIHQDKSCVSINEKGRLRWE